MARNIRSGQILSPFGIGQMVNFPGDESLMICGLDAWDAILNDRQAQTDSSVIDLSRLIIKEERLQALLNVTEFRRPYPYIGRNSTGVNTRLTIPAVRFPQWHYCVRCHVMRRVELTLHDRPVCQQAGCTGNLLPVRFVAVCSSGHIQDVPFVEWVHRGPKPDDGQNHILSYVAGSGSGDLSGISIHCSCGVRPRTLAGIMGEHALARLNARDDADEQDQAGSDVAYTCHGYRPWLGPEGFVQPQNCPHELRVLIRGGSNIHYSVIKSALYLPGFDEQINPVSGKIIEKLGRLQLEDMRKGGYMEAVLKHRDEVTSKQVDIAALLADVNAYLDSINEVVQEVSEETLRQDEYDYILAGRDSENADLKAVVKEISGYTDADYLGDYFESVVLIERLRETRAFVGFTRINPEDDRDQQHKINDLRLTQPVPWLPAHVVFGEGVFLKFNTRRIDQWLLSGTVKDNARRLITSYHDARRNRWQDYDQNQRSVNPAFIMMHTFAHLLINRLCFNCGYGSSSLRERIYFSSDPAKRMNGILIYTSSGDSEGSMGGLVRQGREDHLAKLVREAVDDARWCSSDPVCSDVGGTSGQGPDGINGAACHNCAIVPETSCEEFNMLLDRALVVDTTFKSGTGYFA